MAEPTMRATLIEAQPGLLMSLIHNVDVGLLFVSVFFCGRAVYRTYDDTHSIAQALIRHHFGD